MTDATFTVRLHARSGRNELGGTRGGVLQARVTSPPVDGKANRALCRLLAKHIGVAPSRVSVVRGERSREKLVRVEGMDQGEIDAALVGL